MLRRAAMRSRSAASRLLLLAATILTVLATGCGQMVAARAPNPEALRERTVVVHKLVCEGTLEERISELIDSKRELAASVLGSGEHWLTELSTDELRSLVALAPGAAR